MLSSFAQLSVPATVVAHAISHTVAAAYLCCSLTIEFDNRGSKVCGLTATPL
jgi:hypothetical protein